MNTRKYPRTMVEAFGPYANQGKLVTDEPEMTLADKVIAVLCCLGIALMVAIVAIERIGGAA